MKPFPARCRAAAIGLLLAVGVNAPASAATLTVTSRLDAGPGTLRQAVADAHSGDTINFDFTWPAGIGITNAPLYITKNLNIVGPGADKLTIEGNLPDNPLLQNHFSSTVTISGVRIRHGGAGAIYIPGGAWTLRDCAIVDNLGHAIIVSGSLTVDNCVFSGNQALDRSPSDFGGAIRTVTGTATISNSTFDSNESDDGCGAVFNGGDAMTIRNSTFSNNKTFGNNISQGGALCSPGALTVESSTFSGNYARGPGGAIRAGNGTLTGLTFKDNFSPQGSNSIYGGAGLVVRRSILENCNAQLGSGGDNIAGDASCFAASAELNDRVGLDPRLGELADNGGPTKTIALRAGSPAVDQVIVNAAGCAGTDQRGLPRPGGPRCDVGAVERDGDLLFDDRFE
jgi:predicted outer membrane repeat protein